LSLGNLTLTLSLERRGNQTWAVALAHVTQPVWDDMPIQGYGHATRAIGFSRTALLGDGGGDVVGSLIVGGRRKERGPEGAVALALVMESVWDDMPIQGYGHATRAIGFSRAARCWATVGALSLGNLTLTLSLERGGDQRSTVALAHVTQPVWDDMPIQGNGHATRTMGFSRAGRCWATGVAMS